VDQSDGDHDGAVLAYQHNTPTVDVQSTDPLAIARVELYEPVMITERLVAQYSVFTAEPDRKGASRRAEQQGRRLETWTVSAKAAPAIKRQLLALGMSRSRLFPDLDALCSEISEMVT